MARCKGLTDRDIDRMPLDLYVSLVPDPKEWDRGDFTVDSLDELFS